MKRLSELLNTLFEENNIEDTITSYKDLKIPDKFVTQAVANILDTVVKKEEKSLEIGSEFMIKLRKQNIIFADKMTDGLKQLVGQSEDTINIREGTSTILTSFINEELITMEESFELKETSTKLIDLYMLVLQKLSKQKDKPVLLLMFNDSKVNLMNLLPEADRTKEVLAENLERYDISFLLPLLRIQAELWDALNKEPTPLEFFKYIKDNLDIEYHSHPSFVNALVTVVIKYIVHNSTYPPGTNPCDQPDKITTEDEKELLSKYKPVMDAFLHDKSALQVTAIYALQVFSYSSGFPKGMLLRWFVLLYDLEIIEEEAFLAWKEDLSQDYPGKGKALFQVNQWLTWLQETEEDEEEEEEPN